VSSRSGSTLTGSFGPLTNSTWRHASPIPRSAFQFSMQSLGPSVQVTSRWRKGDGRVQVPVTCWFRKLATPSPTRR
jgi:hypothetical protein